MMIGVGLCQYRNCQGAVLACIGLQVPHACYSMRVHFFDRGSFCSASRLAKSLLSPQSPHTTISNFAEHHPPSPGRKFGAYPPPAPTG